jgi:hypothetical protein
MSESDSSLAHVEPTQMKEALRLLFSLKRLLSPISLGFEKVSRKGSVLFTGSHAVFGVLDVPMQFMEIHEKTGVRALIDDLRIGQRTVGFPGCSGRLRHRRG